MRDITEIKFRGRRTDNGEWVEGDLTLYSKAVSHITVDLLEHEVYEVYTDSVGQFTHLKDKNGREIYEGDITELEVDGEIRRFIVNIKTVIRDVVSHPSFYDETAKVAITGVVFEWEGFELFPCVDEKGISDNEKMVVVGNIYDNPELLGDSK